MARTKEKSPYRLMIWALVVLFAGLSIDAQSRESMIACILLSVFSLALSILVEFFESKKL